MKKALRAVCLLVFGVLLLGIPFQAMGASSELSSFDLKVKKWAQGCRDQTIEQLELLLTSGQLSMGQVFDTFYVPIPGTEPQKFNTQYDLFTDGSVQFVLDSFLEKDERLSFVVIVDRNGYLPTHNSRYSRPLTGDRDVDTQWNRTKRIFNDRTGLSAARSRDPYLLQRYSRDTGEVMSDFSLPLILRGRHWGAVRIGYQ